MKPLHLKMKAFLGFKEETEIDFRPLYEDKIFLITGPTGSGKTSIFDAVAYALYGEGSGETRTKAKCFRSQLAGEKESMEVDLKFEVRGVLYHVYRAENAKGINKAIFYKVSEPEIMWTKIREVNQEIETIIGLNLDQFKKIVMIPQGEFREFLTAGTKDKSEILKKLFATEQYEIFQRKIKESFDEVISKDRELVKRFTQIIQDTGLEERDITMGPDALKEVLEQEQKQVVVLKEEEEQSLKKTKALEMEIEQAKFNNEELKKFEKVRDDYLIIEAQRPAYEEKKNTLILLRKVLKVASIQRELLQKEKEIQRFKLELEELTQQKRTLATLMKTLSQTLSVARDEEKTLDDKKAKKNKLNDLISKSIYMEELNKNLGELISKSQGLQKKIDLLKIKKEELQGLKDQKLTAQEESHHRILELSKLDLTLKEKEERLKIYRMLYLKNKRREEFEGKISELKETEKTIWRELVKAREEYKVEEEKRNQSYALVLRDELKDEEPCPVCGSLHHPLNVSLTEHYDQDTLRQLSSQVKKLEEKERDFTSELKSAENSHEDLREEISQLNVENHITLTSSTGLAEKGAEKKEQATNIQEEQKKIRDEGNQRKDEILKLTMKIEEFEKMVKDETELSHQKSQLDERKNALKGELSSLQNEGTPDDANDIKEELLTLEKTIELIEKRVKRAQGDYELALEKDHTFSGRESELSRALVQAVDLEKKHREEFFAALEKENLKQETYLTYRDKLGEIESLEKEGNEFDRAYYEKKGIFESMRSGGEKRRVLELEPMHNKLFEANKRQIEKLKELKEKEFLVLNLSKAHSRLGETYSEYMENKKELEVLQNLYDTANLGMGFETFVQSYYFEGILIRANQRLKKMSEGRYQLRRRNETENRREKIGLGLNVFDEYSGRERDVLSLSGGESFKASLSLALGLSDFIESHKGSVNLETIFIDEGFGSLDQDSLDNALECLLELNISGRIVGIISHVTELKDRIPGRIEVTSKPGQGSRTKVNGGIN